MGEETRSEDVWNRYRRLQRYVGWTDQDARHVAAIAPLLRPAFDQLIEDFYGAIGAEPEAAKVVTGGPDQIDRLKGTLRQWLDELVVGSYDKSYVRRRWKIGLRHVEIGLDQAFVNAALSRVRDGLLRQLESQWIGDRQSLCDSARSLSRLIDLDLAIIQDAYESEYVRRQRQAERSRSAAVFHALVEGAGSMIVILRADGSIAYFNRFAEQLTGYSKAEVNGKDYIAIFLPEAHRPAVARDMANVLAGEPSWGYENPIRCRDRSERWLVWNAHRIDDYEGSPGVLAIGQDITERKMAEAQALQTERLAAIGQTVAGLAHESRNAFQRSQACLELLALELEDRPAELELVQRAQRALDHVHRLYEEVRNYAGPIQLDRQPCDLAHLWRDAWSQLEMCRKGKSITLTEVITAENATCHVDWFTMGQVFRNILENAVSACPDPGLVEIRCGDVQWDGKPAVQVSVRDNGPGIPTEIREHVFQAFFTSKPAGTGLGMAIARRIVEAHQGRITLGNPPEGAEFLVTLPRNG